MSSTARASPTSEAPVGVLGGTFDPIHNAHLRLAEVARDRFGLAQVRFIPAGRPWHRETPRAAPEDRLAMVRLAIAGRIGFEVDDAEVRADAPGYTFDTLTRLRRELGPTRPVVLLLGADAFLGLPEWHRWQDLFGLAHLAVATRPGHELLPAAMPAALAREFEARLAPAGQLAPRPAGAISPFALSAGTVSSTMVRNRRAAGESLDDLLPDDVLDYIDRRHLYLG